MTYIQTQNVSVFFDYDNDFVTDIIEDRRLQTFIPQVYRLHVVQNELDRLKKIYGTYGVGTPRIKNEYEAQYKKSITLTGESKMTDVVLRKATLEQEEKTINKELSSIAESIRETLTDDEIDLLAEYYEHGKSYQQIGDERFMSKDTVRRKFQKMRRDLFNYEH